MRFGLLQIVTWSLVYFSRNDRTAKSSVITIRPRNPLGLFLNTGCLLDGYVEMVSRNPREVVD